MHRLWITIGSVATVAALAIATFNLVSLVAHETVTERATFDATGIEVLDVASDNGTIEVVGADVDEIRLTAEIGEGLIGAEHRTEVEGDTLVVESHCPQFAFSWCSADYRLVVPEDISVLADSDNGRLLLRDLTGDVDVDSDNGRIELVGLEGDVEATTSNGRIEARGLRADIASVRTSNGSVELGFADAPTTVVARTSNGSVEVIVPDDGASYRVDTDTDNGSTDAAVRTDPSSERSIVAETHNGSVHVRYPTG